MDDIKKALKQFIKDKSNILFSVCLARRNPYFNMLQEKKGKLNVFSKTGLAWDFKNKKIHRRQDAPKCFDLTTACYVFKPKYIKKTLNLFSGKVGFVLIPRERSIDIDDHLDYKIASFLAKF